MQLPDWCFGRKFVVSAEVRGYNATNAYDISELEFPEVMVIWQIKIEPFYMNDLDSYVRIALGHQLPATEAAFMLLDPLINGYGTQGPGPRQIRFFSSFGATDFFMRTPIAAAGRNLCLMGVCPESDHAKCRVSVICSSVPTEVPDWLLSNGPKI